ncbi:GPCR family 2 secretin-like, partial [Trinorchestia longiramus]
MPDSVLVTARRILFPSSRRLLDFVLMVARRGVQAGCWAECHYTYQKPIGDVFLDCSSLPTITASKNIKLRAPVTSDGRLCHYQQDVFATYWLLEDWVVGRYNRQKAVLLASTTDTLIALYTTHHTYITTASPTTESTEIETASPPYQETADTHFSILQNHMTDTDGVNATYMETDAPFGFGYAVLLESSKKQCLQADKITPDSGIACVTDPNNCSKKGLSFSIWERHTFTQDEFVRSGNNNLKDSDIKYVLSTGGDMKGHPGIAFYHWGVFQHVVVSTGAEYWHVRVPGLMENGTWANIGIRWNPNVTTDANGVAKSGGLELFINKKREGRSFLPQSSEGAKPSLNPPELMLGCHKTNDSTKYRYFGDGEYDELAFWKRSLPDNETDYFLGGYLKNFGSLTPQQMSEKLANIDKTNPDVLGNALLVLDQMTQQHQRPTSSPETTASEIASLAASSPTPAGPNRLEALERAESLQAREDLLDITEILFSEKNVVDVMTYGQADKILVRHWCGIGVVLVWYWCGIGMVLVWCWCGFGGVVLVWYWCGGVVLVWYRWCGGEAMVLVWWCGVGVVLVWWCGVGVVNGLKVVSNLMPPNSASEWKTIQANGSAGSANLMSNSVKFGRKTFCNIQYNNNTRPFTIVKSFDHIFFYGQKMLYEDLKARGRYVQIPDYGNEKLKPYKAKWNQIFDMGRVMTNVLNDDHCDKRPVCLVTIVFDTYDDVGPCPVNIANIPGDSTHEMGSRLLYGSLTSDMARTAEGKINYSAPLCQLDKFTMSRNPFYTKLENKVRVPALRQLRFHSDEVVSKVSTRRCAFWNEKLSDFGAWDTDGCQIVDVSDMYTACSCEKFGSMIVLDEKAKDPEIPPEPSWLRIVKLVFYCISAVLLILYCIVVGYSRDLKEQFHLMGMYLSISVLIGSIAMLVSDLDSIRSSRHLCTTLSTLTHFFYVAAGLWVACLGHASFKAITSGEVGGKLNSYSCIAWGIALFSVGVPFAFFERDLGTDPRCFVTWENNGKAAFFLPQVACVCVAFFFSIVVFFNLSTPALRKENLVEDYGSFCRGAAFVMFYFAVTWVFGLLAYMRFGLTVDFYPLFQVFNSAMGIIIFIFIGIASHRYRTVLFGKAKSRHEKIKSLNGIKKSKLKEEPQPPSPKKPSADPTPERPATQASLHPPPSRGNVAGRPGSRPVTPNITIDFSLEVQDPNTRTQHKQVLDYKRANFE